MTRNLRAKRTWKDIVPLVCLLAGIALVAFSVASDLVESALMREKTTSMISTADGYENPEELVDAEAYNALLGNYPLPDGMQAVDVSPYEEQMDIDASMCYVDIPSIAIQMPVYHGTGDEALAAGIGHVEGTSLPVGGPSSNCVLTAHSGMQGKRAFDDMRILREGDIVLIHSMGEVLAYSVTCSVTIHQDNTEQWEKEISIQPGEDELTLVTCTPYGVNDHRLIVHATRTEYTGSEMENIPVTAYLNPRYLLLFAVLIVVLVSIGTHLWRARKGRSA